MSTITQRVVSDYLNRREPTDVLNLVNDYIQLKVDQASLSDLKGKNVMMDITKDIYEATELAKFLTMLMNVKNAA